MKKITQFSVNYPVTILMIVCAVLLLGYISFGKLGIDLLPELTNPRIFVEIKAGERPPEEIEKQFVENIESLSMRQKDVLQVSSICRSGSAQITVEYAWNKDMDEAFLDLQKTLTSYNQNSDIDEFNITQHDPNAEPVMIVGLSHATLTDMNELRKSAENYIRNELVRLEGIADVKLSGQEESEITISTNDYILEAHGLTTSNIIQQIQNFNSNVSGGSIVELGTQYIIKGMSLMETPEDIGNIIVGYKQTEGATESITEKVPVFLHEVAEVKYNNKEPVNIVRINQNRCIGLSIYKETKFNTVKAVQELEKAFVDIKRALPGYEFTIIQNQGKFISNAINEVEETALIGIFFAVLVLFIFLRRIGATAIISVAIPISIVATFNLMYFNGLTLNIMTLGGLALGAGMLVDNAIVVMENIYRNLESGLSIKEAAIQGTTEVGGAITASTITTIVVFLPIVYLHGASGELFKDQAWTVAFSLLSSLFVAILVIPMLASRFLKPKPVKKKKQKSIQFKWYPSFLTRMIRLRWIIIPVAAIMVFIGILLIPVVGSEYIPKTDTRQFSVEIKLPEGTRLERTTSTTKNIEGIIRSLIGEDLETLYSQIGPSPGVGGDDNSFFEDENTASIMVIMNEESILNTSSVINSIGDLLTEIPDMEVEFNRAETALQVIMGTDEAPMVVEIRGKEFDKIEELTEQVKENMMENNDLFNVKSSIEEGAPEIEVIIDRLRAGLFNFSVTNISGQIENQLMGEDAGQIEKEGEMIDMTIKLPEKTLRDFPGMILKNGTQNIRLDEIATINTVFAPKEIIRRNQNRIARVSAEITKDKPFDHIAQSVEAGISTITTPPDYQIKVEGEEQKRKESMENLTFALILSIVLVYMVLASQFESLIHPFTILLTIPLAGVGAILIFYIVGIPLSIMAYIGVIMLIGIAVNDSIILVDAINRFKKEGLSKMDAIVQAGNQRIRPIVMTSITTILALLPLTFGFGESASLRSPMALAVIGGLVTSTLLTLIVIPCVYYVLDYLTPKGKQITELAEE